MKPLNDIFNSVYQTYYNIIKNFRNDLREFENNEFPLPIGLFSSMILANLYLKDFDSVITKNAYITYYGRYVDDILLVFNKTIDDTNDSNKIIRELLVENNYLQEKEDGYLFVGYNNLKIQHDKIKVIYVDCNESRAIIDTYNDTIKIIPSQMNIIPDDELDLLNFDENIYSIEHFNKNDKLRDIGSIKIDTYRVSRYFSSLLYKFKNINIASSLKEIEEQIPKMEKFFTGNRSLEFYTVWLNYMYFLVLTGNKKSLAEFYKKIKKQIDELTHNFIDRNYVKRLTSINKRVKDALKKHLDICLYTALALNLELTNKERAKERAKLYINSNMFNHNLVTLPLSNYLEYDGYVPYINMSTDDLGIIPNKFEDSFKVVWSPRFIHYEEILLLLFYYFHEKNKLNNKFNYYKDAFVEKFKNINGIKYDLFNISTEEN
ncbi:MAG: hypothetical protein IJ736_02505, partial [Firmicutes bacterium]|nr:hypothetical protein [Bacillota bacterium]